MRKERERDGRGGKRNGDGEEVINEEKIRGRWKEEGGTGVWKRM